jgi:hypothetical protein
MVAMVGCTNPRSFVTPAADSFARGFVDSLRANESSAVQALSPRLRAMPGVSDSLAHVASMLPAGPVDTFELVGARSTVTVVVSANSGRHATTQRIMTYRVHAMSGWAIVLVVVLDEPGSPSIDGINVRRVADSTIARNRFTWQTATVAGVVASAAAIGLAIFCVVTGVIIARTPMPRRWLWSAISLIGVGSYAIPWSGGPSGWGQSMMLLPAAGLRQFDIVGPMYILLAFPLGALLALGRRDELLARAGRSTHGLAATVSWSLLRYLARLVVPRTDLRTIPIEAWIWAAIAQIAGGLVGISMFAYVLSTRAATWNGSAMLFLILCAASIAAGMLLWRGQQAGLALSRLLLSMQVAKVSGESIAFGLTLVPLFGVIWTKEQHNLFASLPGFAWRVGPDPDPAGFRGIVINLLAAVLLVLLLIRWPPRGLVANATSPTGAPPPPTEVVLPEVATSEGASAQPATDAAERAPTGG